MNNVTLFSVFVVEQSDTSSAIRIILDRSHFGGNPKLVSFEVDDAIELLVAASLVSNRHSSDVISSTGSHLRHQQRLLGMTLGDIVESGDRCEAQRRC